MKYIASKINAGIRDRSIKIGEDGTIDCKDFEVYD